MVERSTRERTAVATRLDLTSSARGTRARGVRLAWQWRASARRPAQATAAPLEPNLRARSTATPAMKCIRLRIDARRIADRPCANTLPRLAVSVLANVPAAPAVEHVDRPVRALLSAGVRRLRGTHAHSVFAVRCATAFGVARAAVRAIGLKIPFFLARRVVLEVHEPQATRQRQANDGPLPPRHPSTKLRATAPINKRCGGSIRKARRPERTGGTLPYVPSATTSIVDTPLDQASKGMLGAASMLGND